MARRVQWTKQAGRVWRSAPIFASGRRPAPQKPAKRKRSGDPDSLRAGIIQGVMRFIALYKDEYRYDRLAAQARRCLRQKQPSRSRGSRPNLQAQSVRAANLGNGNPDKRLATIYPMKLVRDADAMSGAVSYRYMMQVLKLYNGCSKKSMLPVKF